MHHKFDAYEKFEEISHLIKKTHLKITDVSPVDLTAKQAAADLDDRLNIFLSSCRNLIEERPDVSTDDDSLLDDSSACMINDVVEEMRMFEWAGISFGEDEHY